MLAEYGAIDVALDPFPFTGGVTTCEALWMGVPVLTLTGESVIERQSASLLKAIGAEDLVAMTPEGYRRAALALARDQEGRSNRRRMLREAMRRSALTDAAHMARALETVYRRAVDGGSDG
jgi:predicted O-linked N-acetylglucosamine transferase (SPINDLY family)